MIQLLIPSGFVFMAVCYRGLTVSSIKRANCQIVRGRKVYRDRDLARILEKSPELPTEFA